MSSGFNSGGARPQNKRFFGCSIREVAAQRAGMKTTIVRFGCACLSTLALALRLERLAARFDPLEACPAAQLTGDALGAPFSVMPSVLTGA